MHSREKIAIILAILMLITGVFINEYAVTNATATSQSQRLYTEDE
ncbi:MAG: hypothetical protein ACRDB0_01680 [Paraclostridium sp.]